MVRTQIYLYPAQHRLLKKEAQQRDISMAQLFREIVGEHMSGASTKRRFTKQDYMAIVGLGDSGRSDISEKHDEYVGQAILDDHSRSTNR